jgi:hypothetical protein
MGRVKIPYYVVVKGRGYWRPHPRMRALGFSIVRCGADGPAAWALADEWNRRWQAVRRGDVPAPILSVDHLSAEQAEAARRYPAGSVGSAWQSYIRTDEWKGRALSARQKIWWPAWFRIRDMWGDVAPDTIAFEMMSAWRAALERKHGRGVAHKTMRVWRTLWRIMRGMKVARTEDPLLGVRNRAPAPRWQQWTEGEAVRLVKEAWRRGYHGLAYIIAVSWDTSFSPVDVRTLAARHQATSGGRMMFDRQADGRAKTGRPAIGTVSARTEKMVLAYFHKMSVELHPDAILFRTRSGSVYREATLAHDFSAIRALAFPGDTRRLMDMRRSGTVEAVAGGATALGLAAKLANSINRSNALHKTYAPGDVDTVRDVDDARIRGRRKMRNVNEQGVNVSTKQPSGVSTLKTGGRK